MKALFIHDNMVTVYQNKYYGNGSLTAKTFNRYLNVFDSLNDVLYIDSKKQD